jgi:hypothetical protein
MDIENEYAPVDVVEQEETTSEEVTEESNDDTVTLSKSEYSKLKRQAIAYKANKTEKTEVREQTTTNSSLSEEAIEAKILLSQGKSPELIEEMKALAKVRGKSLLEIQNDPILLAMEKARDDESNAKKVKLGAARGSSTVQTKKSTATANLSAEEHKALWKEQNS